MASNAPEPTPPRPGTLQSMLARLRGMAEAMLPKAKEPEQEVLPSWDASGAPQAAEPAPAAATAEIPVATPVASPAADSVGVSPAPAAGQLCPHCNAPRDGAQSYCDNCGWIFPPTAGPAQAAPADPAARLGDRYELGELVSDRGVVARFRALDHGAGTPQPVAVLILRAPVPRVAEAIPAAEEAAAPAADEDSGDAEILPSFDLPPTAGLPVTEIIRGQPAWPSIAWERALLEKAQHPTLPHVLDQLVDGDWEYLVEELPHGQALWDAWDDPEATAEKRFGWLKQVAEALQRLHEAGAILEALRPDIVVVAADGQARLTDVADLLPLPLPADPPIRGTLYTAPELAAASDKADARADLYSFGAMLYALHVGRELAEMDFDRNGVPKAFIPRFPDIHPLFGRLLTKTFCRDVDGRFPTDEASREDATGFTELIHTLEVCQRTLDNVRLEIAAWTTTGMVRTGNEDAFALLHGIESRQDDLNESALVLLCDGMGGYEAGEVAAALAIQALRRNLLQQRPFAFLGGASSFQPDGTGAASGTAADVETCQRLLLAALRDANKQVFTAARTGIGRRGMGCTAEAVFVNGRHVVVGHVGDSRTYHLHQGRLVQLTRDQTLVNRLVELGTLTPEEAESHPRRSEQQQAIGGHQDVEPALYHGTLNPGDWVVVCSDGLSNHVTPDELKEMLQSEAG
ncbi:MAG TPA: protein phosphatase 2C domain-containing protein, partial [Gemmataceae bacterium]|nr:protein phosphatase 2C domain-containing protein [Gemmataceae bacterium]